MKRASTILLPLVLCGALLFDAAEIAAQPSPSKQVRGGGGNFGLGVTLAGPTGVSAKLFLAPNHALQFQLAWMPFYHHGAVVTFDYLWHPATLVSASVLNLVPYVGPGLGIAFWDHKDRGTESGLMLRVLGGLAIHWRKVPLDTVLELGWTPFFVFDRDFGPAHWDVSLKVRYYF